MSRLYQLFRVRDVDFDRKEIFVRSGKGNKGRVTTLPETLEPKLKQQLEQVKHLHQAELAEGYGRVYLPFALDRKYPNAGVQLGWQYFFPSNRRSEDPRTGLIARHHLHEKKYRALDSQCCAQSWYLQTGEQPYSTSLFGNTST